MINNKYNQEDIYNSKCLMSMQILGIVNKSNKCSQSNCVIISKDFLKSWGQKIDKHKWSQWKTELRIYTFDVMVHAVSTPAVLICSVQWIWISN